MKMSEERLELMLDQIAENDPERAENLRTLRQENPEAFRDQIREMMQRRSKDGRGGKEGQRGRNHDRDGRTTRNHEGRWKERMQEKHEEYIEWLEKNYPDKARELAEMREKDPEVYIKNFMASKKVYGSIKEAQKKNPELATVLTEQLEVKKRRSQILQELRSADDKESKVLAMELEEVVDANFDLIVRKKQLQYDAMLQRLEKLQKQVAKQQAELDKLKSTKEKAVAERTEELLNKTEKINWDQ